MDAIWVVRRLAWVASVASGELAPPMVAAIYAVWILRGCRRARVQSQEAGGDPLWFGQAYLRTASSVVETAGECQTGHWQWPRVYAISPTKHAT